MLSRLFPVRHPSSLAHNSSRTRSKHSQRTALQVQWNIPFLFLVQVFFFAAPPGMRLNLRGSFLDIRALSLVPLPPSQKPWPFFPTSPAWQRPQSSGR